MKSFGKRGRERMIKQTLVEEIDWLSQHCDLLTLISLHEEFGFGADRLRRFFHKISVLHDEFKKKYVAADDKQLSEKRCDTYAMKEYLKRIGFDYDFECDKELKELGVISDDL